MLSRQNKQSNDFVNDFTEATSHGVLFSVHDIVNGVNTDPPQRPAPLGTTSSVPHVQRHPSPPRLPRVHTGGQVKSGGAQVHAHPFPPSMPRGGAAQGGARGNPHHRVRKPATQRPPHVSSHKSDQRRHKRVRRQPPPPPQKRSSSAPPARPVPQSGGHRTRRSNSSPMPSGDLSEFSHVMAPWQLLSPPAPAHAGGGGGGGTGRRSQQPTGRQWVPATLSLKDARAFYSKFPSLGKPPPLSPTRPSSGQQQQRPPTKRQHRKQS